MNPITLTIPFWSSETYEAIDLGVAFKTYALKHGGDGRVYRDVLSMRVELDGVKNSTVQDLIDAFLSRMSGKAHHIAITYAVRHTPLSTVLSFGEIISQPMTKKVLKDLPAGAWLVRRDLHWTKHVEPDTDRDLLWKEVVMLRNSRRRIDVVWCQEDAESLFGR